MGEGADQREADEGLRFLNIKVKMYINNSNKELTSVAQELRKNMTKEERHLWYDFLKPEKLSFKRQKIIGRFIVDFACENPKIIIELDGEQHYSNLDNKRKDEERDKILYKMGYKVLRYSNYEIARNFRGVCDEILYYIKQLEESN